MASTACLIENKRSLSQALTLRHDFTLCNHLAALPSYSDASASSSAQRQNRGRCSSPTGRRHHRPRPVLTAPARLPSSPCSQQSLLLLYQHSVRLGFSFTFSLHFHFLPLFYIFLLKHFLPKNMLHNYFQLCEISPFKTPGVPPYMDVDFIVFINKKYN